MQNDAKYTSHPTATRSSWRAAQLNESPASGCNHVAALASAVDNSQPCIVLPLRWLDRVSWNQALAALYPASRFPESRTEMTGTELTGCLCFNLRHWLRLAVSAVAHRKISLCLTAAGEGLDMSGRIPMWRSGRKSFRRVIISSFILPCGGPLFRHAPRLAEEVIPAVAIIGVVEEAGEEIAHCVECEFPIASQVLMIALCSWSSSMNRVVNLSCKWVLVNVALFLAPHFTHCQHIAGCIRCQIAVSWLETAIVATCNSMGMALSAWRSGLEWLLQLYM